MKSYVYKAQEPPDLVKALEDFGEYLEGGCWVLNIPAAGTWYYKVFPPAVRGGDCTGVFADEEISEKPRFADCKDRGAFRVFQYCGRYSVVDIPLQRLLTKSSWDVECSQKMDESGVNFTRIVITAFPGVKIHCFSVSPEEGDIWGSAGASVSHVEFRGENVSLNKKEGLFVMQSPLLQVLYPNAAALLIPPFLDGDLWTAVRHRVGALLQDG